MVANELLPVLVHVESGSCVLARHDLLVGPAVVNLQVSVCVLVDVRFISPCRCDALSSQLLTDVLTAPTLEERVVHRLVIALRLSFNRLLVRGSVEDHSVSVAIDHVVCRRSTATDRRPEGLELDGLLLPRTFLLGIRSPNSIDDSIRNDGESTLATVLDLLVDDIANSITFVEGAVGALDSDVGHYVVLGRFVSGPDTRFVLVELSVFGCDRN